MNLQIRPSSFVKQEWRVYRDGYLLGTARRLPSSVILFNYRREFGRRQPEIRVLTLDALRRHLENQEVCHEARA